MNLESATPAPPLLRMRSLELEGVNYEALHQRCSVGDCDVDVAEQSTFYRKVGGGIFQPLCCRVR